MNKFVFFAFLLFMTSKTNQFIRFLGESTEGPTESLFSLVCNFEGDRINWARTIFYIICNLYFGVGPLKSVLSLFLECLQFWNFMEWSQQNNFLALKSTWGQLSLNTSSTRATKLAMHPYSRLLIYCFGEQEMCWHLWKQMCIAKIHSFSKQCCAKNSVHQNKVLV